MSAVSEKTPDLRWRGMVFVRQRRRGDHRLYKISSLFIFLQRGIWNTRRSRCISCSTFPLGGWAGKDSILVNPEWGIVLYFQTNPQTHTV
jgi:hypothetical protein